MSRTSTLTLYDRVTKGRLTTDLRKWSDAGLTYAEMAEQLERKHDVSVHRTTVMRWLKSMDDRRVA